MATRRLSEESLSKALQKSTGVTKALEDILSIDDKNIKIRKNTILKGILNMSDDEIDNYIKSLMKEK